MAGIFVFAFYLFCGVVCARAALWDRRPVLRVWLGLSFGVLCLMWLPALFAFALRFTLAAELCALGAMALVTCAAAFFARKRALVPVRADGTDRSLGKALLFVALPLTLLSGYLQYTHTLREAGGALYTGQSTYGDLCMHLSIITSLRGSALPADYNILPGATLGYPILTDAMSTSLMLFGSSLQLSVILPGTVMSALVYGGYVILAREMTRETPAAVLAAVLLFLNGGLGFLYDFDLSGHDFSKIGEIFTGYYQTPANQPEFNLCWSNLVCDLLLPQRTFLGGWTVLLPGLYFARRAIREGGRRDVLPAALFAGALPMVHAHSFTSLGLYCVGACVCQFFAEKQNRRRLFKSAGLFLALTLLLALPQLFATTLRQATRDGFMRLHFNWVNYDAQTGFVDFYPWFWLKNIGLPLIAMLCALLEFKKRDRMDLAGAACIFIVAEIVVFQPLDYDNNKLFYIWYLLMLPAAARLCTDGWRRLRAAPRARALLAALFVTGSVLSGALSIARETVSNYMLFTPQDVRLAAFIEENTERDDVFMTGLHHSNPVYALAGRDIVCGPSLFLYWHGLNYYNQEAQVKAFYADPAANLDALREHGVRYIVLGSPERMELECDEEALDALFETIYEDGGTKVYKVAL